MPPDAVELVPSRRRTRGLPRRSPSGLEGGSRVDLAPRMALGGDEARAHGSAIHALLERIEWLDGDAPADEEALRAVVRKAAGRAVRVDVVLQRFREITAHPAIAGLLNRAAYPADADLWVLREERFALRMEDVMLSGTFDRLVLTMRGGRPEAAELIDFKTDQVDPADAAALERAVERYRPQIEAYHRAAARLYGLKRSAVRARLAFVSPGIVKEI